MTTVPLVIYTTEGERKVVGEATVEITAGNIEITGDVRDERLAETVQGRIRPGEYSILIQEVAYIPPMVLPRKKSEE